MTLLATQNFDTLHKKTGNSDNVAVNLHDATDTSHYMKCHQEYAAADITARLDGEPGPRCHRKLKYCGDMPCNGIIKTDMVYFGEALPDGAMEKLYSLATKANELWVIGSTLEVYPAAGIVPVAVQVGVPITIMNIGCTQYDHPASRLVHEGIATTLLKLMGETITKDKWPSA